LLLLGEGTGWWRFGWRGGRFPLCIGRTWGPAGRRRLGDSSHVCQGPGGLSGVRLVTDLSGELLLLLQDTLALLHDVLDPFELLDLLGLEVLLVLRQLVDLLLVLKELLRLLFLYLVEVAGDVWRRLRILLQDLILLDALRLVYRCRLLSYLVLQDALADLDSSLHLFFLAEGPGLRRHLSLVARDLSFEDLLGGQLRGILALPNLRLPGRRRGDLESHVLTGLADDLGAARMLWVLTGLLRRELS
jgi:hypothetical protein